MQTDKYGRKTGRRMTRRDTTGGIITPKRTRMAMLQNGVNGKSQRKATMLLGRSGVKSIISSGTTGREKARSTPTISGTLPTLST